MKDVWTKKSELWRKGEEEVRKLISEVCTEMEDVVAEFCDDVLTDEEFLKYMKELKDRRFRLFNIVEMCDDVIGKYDELIKSVELK